ncbi:MAG: hypothetical protein JW940_28260, partial [Polyangiaceae bacterium]|nr:hypothetical protein [Polyangiaceae bacterium]
MGRGFGQMDLRFQQLESAMGKMVNVLEAHDERLEQLVGRIDRLSDQVIRSRTQDLDRMAELDRRLRLLEERQQT